MYTIWIRDQMERFLDSFCILYNGIMENGDESARELLSKMSHRAEIFGKLNFCLAYCATFFFIAYPVLLDEKKLPYGIHIPGVNLLVSPYYEIIVLMELAQTSTGVFSYIPFINVFTSFVVLGITMIRILTEKFRHIASTHGDNGDPNEPPNDKLIHQRFRLYIEYHKRILRYVKELNEIVATAFLVEILMFGVLLCVLLFFVQLVEKSSHLFLGVTFIGFIIIQLFALYWLSNQLIEEARAPSVPHSGGGGGDQGNL